MQTLWEEFMKSNKYALITLWGNLVVRCTNLSEERILTCVLFIIYCYSNISLRFTLTKI